MSLHRSLVLANKALVKRLHKFSGVEETLIRNFIMFSQCLVVPNRGYIDKQIFCAVLAKYFNLTDSRLVHKLFINFSVDGGMSVESFSRILCLFFTADEEIRIDYIFSVIDMNGDLHLQKQELEPLIRPAQCMTDADITEKDETFIDMCNMVYKILGLDDQGLTLDIFRKKAKEETLFSYVLGQIVPSSEMARRFKEMVYGKTSVDMQEMFGSIRYELVYDLTVINEYKYYPVKLELP